MEEKLKDLRRLGDIIDVDVEFRVGDQRIIRGYDNLGMHVLFADLKYNLKDYYLFSTHTKQVSYPNIETDIHELGDYESFIVDKILNPLSPVFCIRGRLGSGKTSVLRFVVDNFILKLKCEECQDDSKRINGLCAWIDLKSVAISPSDSKSALSELVELINNRLWSKCLYYVNPNIEFNLFWDYMLQINETRSDEIVGGVVGGLLAQHPYLKSGTSVDERELEKREKIKNTIASQNPLLYFRYLTLLWRYLIQTRFSKQKGCAVIIIDNLDSLSSDVQQGLLRIILSSAHPEGPTFIIPARPETFERHGLNDQLLDVIVHQGPEPYRIFLDRLRRFVDDPQAYLMVAQSLSDSERDLIYQYISRVLHILHKDESFAAFVKSISGKSTRNLLVLAQGIFSLPVGEYKKNKILTDSVISAMLRYGSHQYDSAKNRWVTNIFDVQGVFEGRYLAKLRLLRFIASRGNACSVTLLISTLSLFGFSISTICQVLNELLYKECQLLTSDGLDIFSEKTGADQEIVSITEIGMGYIDHLVYDIRFVEEIMLDAKVPSTFHVSSSYVDRSCERIDIMIKFLREIFKSDVAEVKAFISNMGTGTYIKLFGPKLISFEIIQNLCDNVVQILDTKKKKNKANIQEYNDIAELAENLLNEVAAINQSLLGVTP